MDPDQAETREQEFQRRWHKAHIARYSAGVSGPGWRETEIAPHAAEATPILDDLRRTRDLSTFQKKMASWVRSFNSGYSGMAGQMIINQIKKMADDPTEAVDVLLDALSTPRDLDDAIEKINLLAHFLLSIKVGAHPSPSRAPFVASYFWALDKPELWPAAWPKSMKYLEFCTGTPNSAYESEGHRYAELHKFATQIDGDPLRFELIASWWSDERPVILDEVLCERAALREGAQKDIDNPQWYLQNAQALVAVSNHIGQSLEKLVSETAGRTLSARKPALKWDAVWPRGDFWVDWRIPECYGLGVRVWLNSQGVAVGLRPYPDAEPQATARALAIINKQPVAGYEVLAGGASKYGKDVGFVGGGTGEIVYAKWFDRAALSQLDLPEQIAHATHEISPLLSELEGRQDEANRDDDQLSAMIDEFKSVTGYPTPKHELELADRREFEKLLDRDELMTSDRADLRRIWNSTRYGSTGPMSGLNKSVRDADDDEYRRIARTFTYLCWGNDPAATRIDRVLGDPSLRVNGLGESVVMKMLAITHPEQFITIYPCSGPKGKFKMLKLLGLPVPSEGSQGELQVAANDAIRAKLDRYFPADPLGIGTFLYWLSEKDNISDRQPESDPLEELADELLVDRAFVDDIVALLDDKKQIVLYGPPGTGKTYFARKLAEALVPDAERRPIVQFHPSTSYEDFFEGYRPEVDSNGSMTYTLTKGPLAQLAARAENSPGRKHLMIIDEINRANLPKVLGELLFLFEYRDTPVQTLYRPDDPFELSKDIWFIGTMNTADRSIALIDAALRRRFHFVPFFPNHGPMAGLLDRWLAREGEPGWVGELVAQVNDELNTALNGPHLQIGPSHFMKKGLDEASVRRIWEYDIEPFIEDQFFGSTDRIEEFRFPAVWSRFTEVAPESVSEDHAIGESEL